MYVRQQVLLEILRRSGGIKPLRLVKLSFLVANESSLPESAKYEFVPYKYGPYSFTLNHEVKSLKNVNLVSVPDGKLRAKSGNTALSLDLRLEINRVLNRYKDVSTRDLLGSVYRRYPWFTVNAANKTARNKQLPTSPIAVYGTGYQNSTVDGLLNNLLRTGIQQIVDVRRNPISRRFGFHRSTLTRLCSRIGILYVHKPELGISSERRQSLSDVTSYTQLFAQYRKEVLLRTDSLSELKAMIEKAPTVLLCREADAHFCHRSELSKILSKTTGLPVRELLFERCMPNTNELKF